MNRSGVPACWAEECRVVAIRFYSGSVPPNVWQIVNLFP